LDRKGKATSLLLVDVFADRGIEQARCHLLRISQVSVMSASATLQSMGDHNSAAECYRTTLQHKPQFTGALINLGHALKAAGQNDQARKLWSQAVAADPELAAKYF
jgi:tetratricopeptide (TPR) repeat protein